MPSEDIFRLSPVIRQWFEDVSRAMHQAVERVEVLFQAVRESQIRTQQLHDDRTLHEIMTYSPPEAGTEVDIRDRTAHELRFEDLQSTWEAMQGVPPVVVGRSWYQSFDIAGPVVNRSEINQEEIQ